MFDTRNVIVNFILNSGCPNPNRAVDLYLAMKDLPFGDLHTHYSVPQVKGNIKWETPTDLFLGTPATMLQDGATDYGFDHYTARIMLAQGVDEKFVFGMAQEEDSTRFAKQRFLAMADSLWRARTGEVAFWFQSALQEVFEIYDEPSPDNFDSIYEEVSDRIKDDRYSPQQVLAAGKVKYALTTDDPAADISEHGLAGETQLIPTIRIDNAIYAEKEGRYDFPKWLNAFSERMDRPISTLEDLKSGLLDRIKQFKDAGCVACDIGLRNFLDVPKAGHDQADAVLKKVLQGRVALSDQEKSLWTSHMLDWICRQNSKNDFAQFFHQGAARDLNTRLFNMYGADIGGDGPGPGLDRLAFLDFFDKLSSSGELARTLIFPLNPGDYDFVHQNLDAFQSNAAGIRAMLQLGIPWWFQDNKDGMANVLRIHARSGSLINFVGMLSDARSLPPVVARNLLFRAVLAIVLCEVLPNEPTERLMSDFVEPICFRNGAKFLGLESCFG